MAVSSPGSTLNFSPTCTTPPDNLPDTAAPELCPLKTLDIGKRMGLWMSLMGGTSLSVCNSDYHLNGMELTPPSKSTRAGPLYHFNKFTAVSGLSLLTRLTPCIAPTGTNLDLEG
jgi:hypothetical protein